MQYVTLKISIKLVAGVGALLLAAGSAQADDLRLLDGTKLHGWFLGGTENNVWFQTLDAPAKSYPLEMVDALTFGPVRGAPTPDGPLDPKLPGRVGQTRTSVPSRVHPPGSPGETRRAPAALPIPPGP